MPRLAAPLTGLGAPTVDAADAVGPLVGRLAVGGVGRRGAGGVGAPRVRPVPVAALADLGVRNPPLDVARDMIVGGLASLRSGRSAGGRGRGQSRARRLGVAPGGTRRPGRHEGARRGPAAFGVGGALGYNPPVTVVPLLTWPIMTVSILLIITSVILTLFILVHKSRGGGMSDLFGGGMSTSMGGTSVAERNLDRLTIIVGLVWLACILGLLVLYRFFPEVGTLGA